MISYPFEIKPRGDHSRRSGQWKVSQVLGELPNPSSAPGIPWARQVPIVGHGLLVSLPNFFGIPRVCRLRDLEHPCSHYKGDSGSIWGFLPLLFLHTDRTDYHTKCLGSAIDGGIDHLTARCNFR